VVRFHSRLFDRGSPRLRHHLKRRLGAPSDSRSRRRVSPFRLRGLPGLRSRPSPTSWAERRRDAICVRRRNHTRPIDSDCRRARRREGSTIIHVPSTECRRLFFSRLRQDRPCHAAIEERDEIVVSCRAILWQGGNFESHSIERPRPSPHCRAFDRRQVIVPEADEVWSWETTAPQDRPNIRGRIRRRRRCPPFSRPHAVEAAGTN